MGQGPAAQKGHKIFPVGIVADKFAGWLDSNGKDALAIVTGWS
jgi:hypothetical protein